MAKVTVRRKKQVQNGLLPLAIAVDGVEQKGLRAGGRVELDLPPGQHSVEVGNSGGTLLFDNSSGDATEILVWVSTFSMKGKVREIT